MGMYTAVAFDFKFKSTTPPEAINMVRRFMDNGGPEMDHSFMFCSYSSYFGKWNIKELTQVDGQWVLKLRVSTKELTERTIRMFMEVVFPFVDEPPETVMVRTIGEEGSCESVYCYNAVNYGGITKTEGWRYASEFDSNHPKRTVDFDPPRNLTELREVVKQKKLEEEELGGGYGF